VAIYLDNHSTTRLDPRVLDAMLPWLTDHYGNAGSATHEMGREAREAVERSRESFAAAIGAVPREIVFTSGATESANLAILGSASRLPGRGHVITVLTEHHAVLDPAGHLERSGHAVTRLPVRPQHGDDGGPPGTIRLDNLEAALRPDTFLVSVMLANNEIGVVQDIPAIADRAHRRGAILHVDCAQAVGRMPVAVDALGADLASFSAHKFHGPKGTGALYVRRRGRAVRIDPLVFGGGQERGMRSGTLDVPGIVGIAAAAGLAVADLPGETARLRTLRDRLWRLLADAIPGVAINGPPLDDPAVRLVNNLNVRVPGVDGQSLLATLAGEGLAVSSGSACSSESPRPSHVLLALGLDDDQARASLRFGLSRFTTDDEIAAAAGRIAAGVARLRSLG
jgi:cysteine desulfurase